MRSLKHFSQGHFNSVLALQEWECICITGDVPEWAGILFTWLKMPCNLARHLKKLKTHNAHVVWLSNNTKALMKERTYARKVNYAKYKKLANKCYKLIKID